ncbi:FAD-dependent monooxygenase [Actinoplanes bogorensis]|uniref:FAD-dependent monooxygenase n=1 Tax=Paractinoplanes bogorensis TaxID=1610840 RepID=A0ABS5YP32_9ACTN|nr:FAD-dependent monooxygenase [Actinoplanes bogorensis]MBU2665138.1 FAD-dependent monooxygenase [Actinoplanes bogorensis]
MTIVIVGAGIGGLALAAALEGQCVVLERGPGPGGAVGGGIQIAPNGAAVLHRLGFAGALDVAARPVERQIRRWRDDSLLGRVPLQRHGLPYYTLRRSTLRQILLGAVGVHFGAACAGVEGPGVALAARALDYGMPASGMSPESLGPPAAGSHRVRAFDWGMPASHERLAEDVRVVLADGTRVAASLVVGADGLHSAVRRAVIDDRLRYSGYVAYRAIVPGPGPGRRVVVRLGPGRHLVSYPVDGGVNVVAIVPAATPPVSARDVAPSEVLDAFPGWHPAGRELLASAVRFERHALFDRPRAAWRRGRVVLLGDAAHPMLPFVAQGACQALEDAAALAGDLDGYPGDRPSRAAPVVAAALSGVREYHLADGPEQIARDQRLAAAPPEIPAWAAGPRTPLRARSRARNGSWPAADSAGLAGGRSGIAATSPQRPPGNVS